MAAMDQSQLEDFLHADRHAILATNGKSGFPQLSPVWYLYENGVFYVSAGAETVKVRNLRRDAAITLCIDGCRGDSRYVVIRGRADLIEPDQPLQQEMRRRIIRRYHATAEAAQRYYRSVEKMPAVLIVVTPQRIISQDFN